MKKDIFYWISRLPQDEYTEVYRWEPGFWDGDSWWIIGWDSSLTPDEIIEIGPELIAPSSPQEPSSITQD